MPPMTMQTEGMCTKAFPPPLIAIGAMITAKPKSNPTIVAISMDYGLSLTRFNCWLKMLARSGCVFPISPNNFPAVLSVI